MPHTSRRHTHTSHLHRDNEADDQLEREGRWESRVEEAACDGVNRRLYRPVGDSRGSDPGLKSYPCKQVAIGNIQRHVEPDLPCADGNHVAHVQAPKRGLHFRQKSAQNVVPLDVRERLVADRAAGGRDYLDTTTATVTEHRLEVAVHVTR